MKKENVFGSRGLTLIEVVVSAALIAILGLALIKGLSVLSFLNQRSRLEIRGHRVLKSAKVIMDSMPFEMIFPMDSQSPNWGLGPSHANYPCFPAMNNLLSEANQAGFCRVRVEVNFLRRDLSNVSGLGTGALIPFTDTNGDGVDDYDPGIAFSDLFPSISSCVVLARDANGDNINDLNGLSLTPGPDGDYFDVIRMDVGGGQFRMFTEMPMTNLRQVIISLYRNGDAISPLITQEYLISKEKLSGAVGTSGESDLKIDVTVPAKPRVFFDGTLGGGRLIAIARGISLITPFPNPSYRADSSFPFAIQGITVPNAIVTISTVTPPSSAPPSSRDQSVANFSGNFNFTAPNVTNRLVEGENPIYFEAVKNVSMLGSVFTVRSPVGRIVTVWDRRPPRIVSGSNRPTGGGVRTLSPVVGATFEDSGFTTTTVSGIDPSVLSITVDPQGPPPPVVYTSPASIAYNHSTGVMKWWNPLNHLPVTLADGVRYDIHLEGGDFAHYGTDLDWDFRVHIVNSDTSPPDVTAMVPPNGAFNVQPSTTIRCNISDPDSGVNYSSVVVTAGATTVLSSAVTPLMGDFIDAGTGDLIIPNVSCPTGASLTVVVTATHWGVTGVPAQDTAIRTWSFSCQ